MPLFCLHKRVYFFLKYDYYFLGPLLLQCSVCIVFPSVSYK